MANIQEFNGNVKVNDLTANNLTLSGNVSVENATINESLKVTGETTVQNLSAATIETSGSIEGESVSTTGDLTVGGITEINGQLKIKSTSSNDSTILFNSNQASGSQSSVTVGTDKTISFNGNQLTLNGNIIPSLESATVIGLYASTAGVTQYFDIGTHRYFVLKIYNYKNSEGNCSFQFVHIDDTADQYNPSCIPIGHPAGNVGSASLSYSTTNGLSISHLSAGSFVCFIKIYALD